MSEGERTDTRPAPSPNTDDQKRKLRVEVLRDLKYEGIQHKAGTLIEVTENQLRQNPDLFRLPRQPDGRPADGASAGSVAAPGTTPAIPGGPTAPLNPPGRVSPKLSDQVQPVPPVPHAPPAPRAAAIQHPTAEERARKDRDRG